LVLEGTPVSQEFVDGFQSHTGVPDHVFDTLRRHAVIDVDLGSEVFELIDSCR
jgi:hypothetical protein